MARNQAKAKKRFSLLLLEEKEYYFEDYGGFIHFTPAQLSLSQPSSSSPTTSTSTTTTSMTLSARKKIKGRVHLCSKSLFFEPDESRYPITRLPLRDVASIRTRTVQEDGIDQPYFILHTRSVVSMESNSPYVFTKLELTDASSEFFFSLSYVELNTFMKLLTQLHTISRMPSGTPKYNALSKLISERESRIQFDTSWIVDLREKMQLERALITSQVTPLVVTPGCLMITDQRIYFQPFNNVSTEPVLRYALSDISRIYRRRHAMRDVGLEIMFTNKTSTRTTTTSTSTTTSSAYWAFRTRQERDYIYELISKQHACGAGKDKSLAAMAASWCAGQISNYDYLLFLNQQAGRSFLDLTQYPVMPWVIADYKSKQLDLSSPSTYRDLSKPIGALNPERLTSFRRRFTEMPAELCQGKPFLYGTHYSTPGYVLYFLVRKYPEYQLRLQNGRFDAPDRLFNSISGTWESCMNAPTDVKELIPEFYTIEGTQIGSFLRNDAGLDLGIRQNGKEVDDVELPPWAKTPKEFITICRQVLESDYVSQNLHHWIDLIFGYKQTGPEAVAADNVFYHLTYEGAVDIEAIHDPIEKRSIEQQISEFGQTPRQIFDKPHPKKGSTIDPLDFKSPPPHTTTLCSLPSTSTSTSTSSSPSKLSLHTTLEQLHVPTHISEPISDAFYSPISSTIHDVSQDNSISTSTSTSDSTSIPSVSSLSRPTSLTTPDITTTDTSSSLATPPRPSELIRTPTVELTTDEFMPTMSSHPDVADTLNLLAELEQLEQKLDIKSPTIITSPSSQIITSPTHISPTTRSTTWHHITSYHLVQSLNLHKDQVTAVGLSQDESLLYSTSSDCSIKIYSLSENKVFRSTKISDLALSSCCLTRDGRSALVGCWDNNIYLYSVGYGRVIAQQNAHDDAVACLAMNGERLISGSWDATVKVWVLTESEISKRPILDLSDHETPIRALSVDNAGNVVASGSEDGLLLLSDLRQSSSVRTIDCSTEITSVQFAPNGTDVFVSCTSGIIHHIDIRRGKAVTEFELSHDRISSLTTDGIHLMIAGDQGMIQRIDIKTQEMISEITTNNGTINTLYVNHDASRIVCGFSRGMHNISLYSANS